jgi:hypothetical protein
MSMDNSLESKEMGHGFLLILKAMIENKKYLSQSLRNQVTDSYLIKEE